MGRDSRWLNDEVYGVLKSHKAALCIHDKIVDHPRQITTGWVYMRFHGGADEGNYTERELKSYCREISGYLNVRLDVYAYFNNDWQGYALQNAARLKDLIDGPSGYVEESRSVANGVRARRAPLRQSSNQA